MVPEITETNVPTKSKSRTLVRVNKSPGPLVGLCANLFSVVRWRLCPLAIDNFARSLARQYLSLVTLIQFGSQSFTRYTVSLFSSKSHRSRDWHTKLGLESGDGKREQRRGQDFALVECRFKNGCLDS